MQTFYMSMECDCGETIHQRMGTFDTHKGEPVIAFDMASQTRWKCDECDAQYATGDFDVYGGAEL